MCILKTQKKKTQSTLSERFWSTGAVRIQRNQTYLQNHHILLYVCNCVIPVCTSVELSVYVSKHLFFVHSMTHFGGLSTTLAALMSGKAPKGPGEVFPLGSSEAGVGFYMVPMLVFWKIFGDATAVDGWEIHPVLLTLRPCWDGQPMVGSHGLVVSCVSPHWNNNQTHHKTWECPSAKQACQ